MIEKYENICNEIVNEFLKKQNIPDAEIHWVADLIGEIVFVNHYYFNFSDIIKDLKLNAPIGLIFKWHDSATTINYYSYIKGLRDNEIK